MILGHPARKVPAEDARRAAEHFRGGPAVGCPLCPIDVVVAASAGGLGQRAGESQVDEIFSRGTTEFAGEHVVRFPQPRGEEFSEIPPVGVRRRDQLVGPAIRQAGGGAGAEGFVRAARGARRRIARRNPQSDAKHQDLRQGARLPAQFPQLPS